MLAEPENKMKSVLGVLVVVAGATVYFVLWHFLAWQQEIPFVSFSLMSLGVIWLARLLWERRTVYRFLMSGIGCVLTGLFVWWTLSYSKYDTAVSDNGDLRLPGHAAFFPSFATKNLSKGEFLTGKTLVVFYRGHW